MGIFIVVPRPHGADLQLDCSAVIEGMRPNECRWLQIKYCLRNFDWVLTPSLTLWQYHASQKGKSRILQLV